MNKKENEVCIACEGKKYLIASLWETGYDPNPPKIPCPYCKNKDK